MVDAALPTRPSNMPHRVPLVGRERELALLCAHLEIGLSGEARLLLLAGEPGIGKTRMAEELASEAVARGALVLWGRCQEAEWTPPYWLWVQVLRAYAQRRPVDALRTELGPGAADIAHLVPEIATRLRDVPTLPALAPEQARFRVFDHIAAFLRRGASVQPLVLILDDLHWADAPSLLLLEFVTREARDAPLMILGTYRDVAVGRQHPLARTLAEVVRAGHSQRIMLRGLNKADVGRLVAFANVRATAELVTAVYDETEGNPFFVHEIAQLLASDAVDGRDTWDESAPRQLPIPQSVREVIGRRLDRLSPACNEVLATAAAIGREFGLPVLARVSGQKSEQILEPLEEATTSRVIEEVPRRIGGYRFAHALIRDTLYDELGAVQKVRRHRRIGLALEALYRSDPEPHWAELAHHFVQAAPGGDVQQAIIYARRAGERALALLAFEDAVVHVELALQVLELLDPPDEPLHCDLLLALAAAHLNAGDVATGRGTYVRAARLAKAAGLPEQLARAALGFGGEPIVAWGFDAELVRVLEEALDLLGPADSPLRAQLLLRLAIELDAIDPERMETLHRDAEAMARRLGDARSLAVALIGKVHVHLGRNDAWDALVATGRETTEVGAALGDRGVMWSASCARICGMLLVGDIVGVDQEIDAAVRLAEESRQPFYLFWTPTLYAMRALMDGRFADAETHLAEAVGFVPRAHLAHWIQWYAPNVFALRQEQEHHDDIEETLRKALAELPDADDPERVLTLRAMLALTHLATGRNVEAQQEFAELAADNFAILLRRRPWGTNVVAGLGYLAEVCATLADAPRAATLYDLLVPYAAQNLVYGGIWHVAGSASHYLGLLATLLGHWDDAERHLAEALAMHERMYARPFVARTQFAYATMLVRRNAPGDHDQAHALNSAALATANELGMARLAREAAAFQAKLVHVRASHAASAAQRAGLTQREFDVLRLVVAGQSNPQIAASLFISPATARTHVSNILAKLGLHSRTEAVDYAHRHGLLLPTDNAST